MISELKKYSPIADGIPTMNMNFKAQLNFSLNSKSFFKTAAFDKAGKMTVAAAMAKIPKGN